MRDRAGRDSYYGGAEQSDRQHVQWVDPGTLWHSEAQLSVRSVPYWVTLLVYSACAWRRDKCLKTRETAT